MKNDEPGMGLVVKTITWLTGGLIFIYGIYIATEGHLGPGGGFAGGVIVALSFIQLILAFGRTAILKKINESNSAPLMGVAAAMLLILFSMGLMCGHISYLCDIVISIMVGAGLFLVFLALVTLKGAKKE